MLPEADGKPEALSGGKTRRKGGMEYLKAEDLSTSPREARIVAVKFDPDHNFGPSVVVKLALDGKVKFWTLRIRKNPNYQILLEAFGRDENSWVEKKVHLWNQEDEFSGQYFPRVGVVPKKK